MNISLSIYKAYTMLYSTKALPMITSITGKDYDNLHEMLLEAKNEDLPAWAKEFEGFESRLHVSNAHITDAKNKIQSCKEPNPALTLNQYLNLINEMNNLNIYIAGAFKDMLALTNMLARKFERFVMLNSLFQGIFPMKNEKIRVKFLEIEKSKAAEREKIDELYKDTERVFKAMHKGVFSRLMEKMKGMETTMKEVKSLHCEDIQHLLSNINDFDEIKNEESLSSNASSVGFVLKNRYNQLFPKIQNMANYCASFDSALKIPRAMNLQAGKWHLDQPLGRIRLLLAKESDSVAYENAREYLSELFRAITKNIGKTSYNENEKALEEPLNDSNVKEPLSGSSVNEPLNDSNVKEPLSGSNVEEPLNDSHVEEPLSDSNVESPLNNNSVEESLNDGNVERPLSDNSAEEPLNDNSVKEPLNDNSNVEEPLNDSHKESPLSDSNSIPQLKPTPMIRSIKTNAAYKKFAENEQRRPNTDGNRLEQPISRNSVPGKRTDSFSEKIKQACASAPNDFTITIHDFESDGIKTNPIISSLGINRDTSSSWINQDPSSLILLENSRTGNSIASVESNKEQPNDLEKQRRMMSKYGKATGSTRSNCVRGAALFLVIGMLVT